MARMAGDSVAFCVIVERHERAALGLAAALEPRDAAWLAAHVPGCPRCDGLRSDLATIFASGPGELVLRLRIPALPLPSTELPTLEALRTSPRGERS